MNDTKQNLGELLKSYRERKFPGQGLRRAAENIDVHYAQIFRIEDGQNAPTPDTLEALLNAYGASAEEKVKAFELAAAVPFATLRELATQSSDKEFAAMFRMPKQQNNHEKDPPKK